MVNIVHRVGIKAPAAEVYAALATVEGIAGWWTADATGESKTGGTLTFRFVRDGQEIGCFDMEVIELTANERVSWRVRSGPSEWVGTEIDFALSRADGMTVLRFGHRHWREETESMAHCSMKWAAFLLSLRQLVETGKGRPAPHDLKIDNWN